MSLTSNPTSHRKAVGIVGARLNSSRLPRKHLLHLAGRPLIARLFERLEQIDGLDEIWLATTADDYNRELVAWAEANGKRVLAYEGEVDDLMGRVDAVVRRSDAQLIAYFCGDSPLIEPTTLERLISALRAAPQMDRAGLAAAPPGREWIHEGFDLYARPFWEELLAASLEPFQREHVGVAARGMANVRVLTVPEEPLFARVSHRLSVDTPSDYRFMRELYRRWYAEHPAGSIVSLPWVIDELERDPALAALNAQVRQKGIHSRSRPVSLVTHATPRTGLGHLRRTLVAAHALQDHVHAAVTLLILGEGGEAGAEPPVADLALVPHRWCRDEAALLAALEGMEDGGVALVDMAWGRLDGAVLLAALHAKGKAVVGLDLPPALTTGVEVDYRPAFHLPAALGEGSARRRLWGWEYYLLPPRLPRRAPAAGDAPRVAVFSGGSDASGLGEVLPRRLDAALPPGCTIDWVRGPYAPPPRLPEAPRCRWRLHHAPAEIAPLMAAASCALTPYGVTLFELLQQGVPTVVVPPHAVDDEEIAALAATGVAELANSLEGAPALVARLLEEPARAAEMGSRAAALLDGRGPERLAALVAELLDARPNERLGAR